MKNKSRIIKFIIQLEKLLKIEGRGQYKLYLQLSDPFLKEEEFYRLEGYFEFLLELLKDKKTRTFYLSEEDFQNEL